MCYVNLKTPPFPQMMWLSYIVNIRYHKLLIIYLNLQFPFTISEILSNRSILSKLYVHLFYRSILWLFTISIALIDTFRKIKNIFKMNAHL